MCVMATPALSAQLVQMSDVAWIAHWLDDGNGNAASQAAVEAADPKRFYTGGDECTLNTDPPTLGEFNPQKGLERNCILGEGRGSGQAGDWNSIVRVRIESGDSLCGADNNFMTFGPLNFDDLKVQVPYERCVFDTNSSPSATVFDFPIPAQNPNPFNRRIEIYLPALQQNSNNLVGYWDFGPTDPSSPSWGVVL